MFFEADAEHGLPRDPFKACVVPRPIGWIATVSSDGHENLAPYSFFNIVAEQPRMVMVCVNGDHQTDAPAAKDTLANLREVPEFVVNTATWDLREAMNASCTPWSHAEDEFDKAGVAKAPSKLVRPSRVAESPINLECAVHQIVELPPDPVNGSNSLIIGRVLGIHIDESVLVDGRIDFDKLQPLGRMGYSQYVVARDSGIFTMRRPDY